MHKGIVETCPSVSLLSKHFGNEADDVLKKKNWFKKEGELLGEHIKNCAQCQVIVKQIAYGTAQ